jgi:hypothetical protein
MKSLKIAASVSVALTLSSLLFFQNCAPARFSQTRKSAVDTIEAVPPAACQSITTVTAPMRVIVAVDNTGSNGSNNYSTQPPPGGYALALGSDNDQYFRQKSVGDLVSSLAPLSNVSYNLMVFQGACPQHS